MKKKKMADLIKPGYQPPPQLIAGWLAPRERMIIFADAGVGKSLFVQEMIYSASKGDMFLECYEVARPLRIAYFQGEGNEYQSIERCTRMAQTVPFEKDNIVWFESPDLLMDRADSVEQIIKELEGFNPDILVFDPLYCMVSSGSLNDDHICSKIRANLDKLQSHFQCAIIVTHHENKGGTHNGKKVERGSDSMYGSSFFKAWPDNIMRITTVDPINKIKSITCHKSRQGQMEMGVKVQLIDQEGKLYHRIYAGDADTAFLFLTATKLAIIEHLKTVDKDHLAMIAKIINKPLSTVSSAMMLLTQGKDPWVEKLDKGVYRLAPRKEPGKASEL